jgi:hypothetical protein
MCISFERTVFEGMKVIGSRTGGGSVTPSLSRPRFSSDWGGHFGVRKYTAALMLPPIPCSSKMIRNCRGRWIAFTLQHVEAKRQVCFSNVVAENLDVRTSDDWLIPDIIDSVRNFAIVLSSKGMYSFNI